MRKRGFTLVELLAVVVILGIIATIIVPNVIEIMNKAEKDSFKTSAYGLWTAAKEYYQEQSEKGRYPGENLKLPTDKLEYEGEEIKKGNVTISSDGKMEIYAGKKKWCAIKGMSDEEIEIVDIEDYPDCGKEHGKPVIEKFDTTNETEGSITLIGVCSDKEYGISQYEYQIIPEGEEVEEENIKWVHTIREAYTFKKLKGNTRYKIKMRCQSKNGVYSDEEEKVVQTKEANVKCYATDQNGKKLEGEALEKVNGEWQREKYIKVEYSASSGSDRSYRIDQGKWKNVYDNPVVSVQKPSTVTGRASDGINISTASCGVGKVDGTSPEASIVVVSANPYAKQVGEGADAKFLGTIKVGGYCIDEESGIAKYEYAISEEAKAIKDIDNWKESNSSLEEFTDLSNQKDYYLYLRCTNNAGMKSTADTKTKLPEVTYPTCELNNYEWSNQEKQLKIGYIGPNEDKTGVDKSYKLLKGEASKASGEKLVELKEEIVNQDSETLTFTTIGHVEATKKKSGAKLSLTCNVTRLDMKKPKIDGVEIIPSGWHNDEKKLKIEKSDEGGSGLFAYYISREGSKPALSKACQQKSSGKEDDNDKWICDEKAELTIERAGTVVPSNGPTSYYLWVADQAGNISDRKEIVIDKIEKTKPTCRLEIVSGTRGTNGWYTSDVKVRMITDDRRGAGEVSGPSGVSEIGIYQTQGGKPPKGYTSIGDTITIKKDGINHVYGYVKDRAGNENECEIKNIKVDQTAPTCVMTMKSGNSTYSSGVWKNTNIDTVTNAYDETSKLYEVKVNHKKPGVAMNSYLDKKYSDSPRSKSESYRVTEEGTHSVQSVITDMAGNVSTCTRNIIKIDKTAPTCGISKNAPTGRDNWYTANINTRLSSRLDKSNALDNTSSGIATYGMGLSTIADYNGKLNYNYGSDSKSVTIYGYVRDNAGNTNRCSSGTLKIDKTPPKCTLKKSGKSGTKNWYRTDVKVSWDSKTDNISGIIAYSLAGVSSETSKTYTAQTKGTTVHGKVINGAGLEGKCDTSFKIDKTPPSVYYTTSAGPHNSNDGITVKNECEDSYSGVWYKDPKGNQHVGSPTKGTTKSVTCYDKAGNKATASRTFKVKKYSANSACGALTCTKSCCGYKTCATSGCGNKTCTDGVCCGWKSCRASSHGCETYKQRCNRPLTCGTTSKPASTTCVTTSGACSGYKVSQCSCKCQGAHDVGCFKYNCSCKKTIAVPKCCRNSSFGCQTYKYKATKACGAKTCTRSCCGYKTCANKACGNKTCTNGSCCGWKSCWHY